MKTLKAGARFKSYIGFRVYCVRIAPHVMLIPQEVMKTYRGRVDTSCAIYYIKTLATSKQPHHDSRRNKQIGGGQEI
ncbi:hypothetical protein SAY87_015678 [Trapa incisa]|uniref:Uncharacterized protein n=1 Tax=Trapa incisa TaxID=236973 RepID=A0AAN7LFJ6_9MYRT|nr:hypothetical protein SAY87_015678 [Trapa incisa]